MSGRVITPGGAGGQWEPRDQGADKDRYGNRAGWAAAAAGAAAMGDESPLSCNISTHSERRPVSRLKGTAAQEEPNTVKTIADSL